MTTRFAKIRAGGDHRRPQLRQPGKEDYYLEREKAADLARRLEAAQGTISERDATIAAQKEQIASLQRQLVRLQAERLNSAPSAQGLPVKRGPGRPKKHARQDA